MSEIYDILSRIFLMVSEYEEEIEQIRIQLNSENNYDLVQFFQIYQQIIQPLIIY